jgi:hypothetical protein
MALAIKESRAVELRKMRVSERSSFPFPFLRLAVSPALHPCPLSRLPRSLLHFSVRESLPDFFRLIQSARVTGSE